MAREPDALRFPLLICLSSLMKRAVILVTAGAVFCAAGVLLVLDSSELPRRTVRASLSGKQSPVEEAPRDGKRRTALASERSNHFRARSEKIGTMPQDTGREEAVRSLAQEWSRESPRAAEDWAEALPDPAERERALNQICLEVSAQDPREAIRLAKENALQSGLLDAVVGRWASSDFDAAAGWARALPEGDQRNLLMARLVQIRAVEEPAQAASLLSEWGLTANTEEEAAMAILHQWLLKDPEAARKWVEMFPDGALKQRANLAVEGMSSR